MSHARQLRDVSIRKCGALRCAQQSKQHLQPRGRESAPRACCRLRCDTRALTFHPEHEVWRRQISVTRRIDEVHLPVAQFFGEVRGYVIRHEHRVWPQVTELMDDGTQRPRAKALLGLHLIPRLVLAIPNINDSVDMPPSLGGL